MLRLPWNRRSTPAEPFTFKSSFFYETALFKNEFNRTLTDVNQTSAVLLLFYFQSNTAKSTETYYKIYKSVSMTPRPIPIKFYTHIVFSPQSRRILSPQLTIVGGAFHLFSRSLRGTSKNSGLQDVARAPRVRVNSWYDWSIYGHACFEFRLAIAQQMDPIAKTKKTKKQKTKRKERKKILSKLVIHEN